MHTADVFVHAHVGTRAIVCSPCAYSETEYTTVATGYRCCILGTTYVLTLQHCKLMVSGCRCCMLETTYMVTSCAARRLLGGAPCWSCLSLRQSWTFFKNIRCAITMHVLLQFYQQMPWLPELAQELGRQLHQTHVVRWGAVVASKTLQCLLSAPVRSICLTCKALAM